MSAHALALLETDGIKALYIEPSCPRENSYNESFNGKLRDELLNCETFIWIRFLVDCGRQLADHVGSKFGGEPALH